jgi:hypothetical protein
MELPLILLTFGTPIMAIGGVICTIRNVDMQPARTWKVQFVTSIVSAILAVLALIGFFAMP